MPCCCCLNSNPTLNPYLWPCQPWNPKTPKPCHFWVIPRSLPMSSLNTLGYVLSYAPDKQTNKQTQPSIVLTPTDSFPRYDAQGYVSARCDSRAETYHSAETYHCASSRGNASRGKDRRVIGPNHQWQYKWESIYAWVMNLLLGVKHRCVKEIIRVSTSMLVACTPTHSSTWIWGVASVELSHLSSFSLSLSSAS